MSSPPELPPAAQDELDDIEPIPEDIESWPNGLAVASQLGKTGRWVAGQVRAGTFHPRLDSKGVRRFDPTEVEQFMPNGSAVAIQNQDGIFRILAENARMLATSNAELLRVLPQNVKGLVDGQNELNRQLLERVKQLEDERQKMLQQAEDAQTKREDRRLERMRVKREQKRLDEALRTFSDIVPKFLDQVFIGKDLSAFLKSIDPALVDGLLAEDMPLLTPEQKLHFKGIWERMQEAKKRANSNGNGKAKPAELDDGKTAAESPPVVIAAPKTGVQA